MSAPLVSIMVPVHNRRALLPDCLKSALAQTCRDLEVVVVDNASTDGTWEVCRQFARADARVRIFRNPENIEPVRNWQRWAALYDVDRLRRFAANRDRKLPASRSRISVVFACSVRAAWCVFPESAPL